MSDQATMVERFSALTARLSDYPIDDCEAAIKRWTDDNPKWPTWSDLKIILGVMDAARRPQLGYEPIMRSAEIEARAMATKCGQRALREGWARSYLIDLQAGVLHGFSFDEDYAAMRLRELKKRRSQAMLARNLPMGESLWKLSQTMDEVSERLKARYLQAAA